MGQALYRKYRSKKLSEIVGQEHITRTLERALKTGKLSHAYLFTGPRGVGKTSIARILAHEINGLPYTDESMHLDIIEIDAASNRRIDEIRDLRDKVHIAPTSGKYKVYIIDEVHMLTKEAFNALLKTLEEPPAHVVFILATTELHKLPETIVSRTQRFTFKPIGDAEAAAHLKLIAKQEGMKIDDEALQLLAAHGKGSFRDSISLLDQVGNSSSTITRADAEKLVGIAADAHISALEQAVLHGTPAEIVSALDSLIADGIGPLQAAKQLSAVLRSRLIAGESHQVIADLLANLLQVPASPEPAGQLEVALFKANIAAHPDAGQSYTAQPAQVQVAEPAASPPDPEDKKPEKPPKTAKKPDKPAEETTAEEESTQQAAAPPSGETAEWWDDVLKQIKTVNNTLYSVLRMAEPLVEGKTLHLRFGFGFHKKKAADSATQTKIRDAVKAVTGKSYKVNAVHDATLSKDSKPAKASSSAQQPADSQELSSITNIFGGAEVLES